MFPYQGGPEQPLPRYWKLPSSPPLGSPPPITHTNTALLPLQRNRPDMAAHQHHRQQYRLSGPYESSRQPQGSYRGAPPLPSSYMTPARQLVAPRQGTVPACRYCRRRKLQCSGADGAEDGRCANCIRFNQDCIFAPAVARTRALAPAHAVRQGVGARPPIYCAHGQRLPPATHYRTHAQPLLPAADYEDHAQSLPPATHSGADAQPPPPATHSEAHARPPPRGQQQYPPNPTGATYAPQEQ